MKKTALILSALLISSLIVTGCGKASDAVYTDVPEYTAGTVTESGYESTWSGIKFTPASNVVMASDEEFEELISEDDMADYEMMATDENYNTVLVRSALMPEGMSLKDYDEAQLADIKSQFEANGLSVEASSAKDVSFGGKTYKGTVYTVSMGESALYQCIYRAVLGDRVSEICFTYSDEAALSALIACFAQ